MADITGVVKVKVNGQWLPIRTVMGPQGATGATGPEGGEGATGPTGPQGGVGPTGGDGATGPTGSEGAVGPTGSEGATGPTGSEGAIGPTGGDGATGPTGPVGSTGPMPSLDGVVKTTGDQTIEGTKKFTSWPVGAPELPVVHSWFESNSDGDLVLVNEAGNVGKIIVPRLNGVMAFLQNLAPDYDGTSSHTYAVDDLRVYGKLLFRCTTPHTATSWDYTKWALATVEDVLAALRTGKQDALSQAQLDNIAAVPNKANASDLRYAISESTPLTVTSGAASTTLADRTHNVRTVSAPGSGNTTTITATLPPIVAGKSRDMFLNLTAGTQASDAGDISLSIVEPSGATVQIDIGSVEDIGIGKNEILISENALPTTSGNDTTTHWLVTVHHEDFT